MNLLKSLLLGVYRAPGVLLVHFIEIWLRIKHLANPLTYSRVGRIVRLAPGRVRADGGRHVVFLTVQRDRLASYTRRAIEAYARAGCNVTVVVNGAPSAALIAALGPLAFQILVRKNIGRDFGGYKDGVLNLFDQQADGRIELNRLILANDSMYYFERGLDAMVSWLLTSHADFVGSNETNELRYHIQSFLLSFSSDVIESQPFRSYWRRYLPIGTRRWAIHHGEAGISRTLVRAGFAPSVLFTTHALKDKLDRLEPADVFERIQLMPIAFRRDLAHQEKEKWEQASKAADSGFEAYTNWFAGLAAISGEKGPAARGASDAVEKYITLGDQTLVNARRRERQASQAMSRFIIDRVQAGSQTHYGALLFMQELQSPILKRDIAYRGIFHAYEILDFLKSQGVDDLEEVAADLRVRGVSTWFRGLQRILYDGGII